MASGMRVGRRAMIGGMVTMAAGCAAHKGGMRIALAPEVAAMPFKRYDSRLDTIVAPGQMPEVLARGFDWIEGPTWDTRRGQLYFNDIPRNRLHVWSRDSGLGVWREPAGSGGAAEGVRSGINGMAYVAGEDALLACDQDSRSILRYDLAQGPQGTPTVIARGEAGNSFNSPNDLVRAADGTLYFTDPPYGLKQQDQTPAKDRTVNGVYARAPDGAISLVDGTLDRPNGIGLSPDEQHLYVANSSPHWQRLVRYSRKAAGWSKDGDAWFDARVFMEEGTRGGADGMAIAQDGTIFATVPGGLAIFSPEAQVLGYLATNRANGNCCFGEDGSTLFLLSDDLLLRLPTRVKGIGF